MGCTEYLLYIRFGGQNSLSIRLNSDARLNMKSSHMQATEYMLYKAENALSTDNR